MSFTPLKSLLLQGPLTVLFFAAITAQAAEPSAGSCGGARYKEGLFAPRLNQLSKRVKDLCKQEKSAANRLKSLASSCGDANNSKYVQDLSKRANELCERGPSAVNETQALCRKYDTAIGTSKAYLARASKMTDSQSEAFAGRSGALDGSSKQMSSVATVASSLSDKLHDLLPEAKKGQKSSNDPKITQLMSNFRGYAKAAAQKKAACKQISEGMEEMSTLMQQNIMPNLRTLQEGVEGVASNASKSSVDTAKQAAADAKLAAQNGAVGSRASSVSGAAAASPTANSIRAPASRPAATPGTMKQSEQEEILRNLSSYN